MAGMIYLVATPIGNLEDITLRALRTLREVDLVACEDTRRTGLLLRRFEIDKPLLSYREHNEAARAAELIRRAQDGASIAVVSDAGMPGIADPGFRVARAAVEAGVRVAPIPGANAATAALTASGLPTDRFRFEGFLPPREAKRRAALEMLRAETATVVLYEAPHRIAATLRDIAAVLGARPLVLARELTKLHEEYLRGTAEQIAAELAKRPAVKGEIVLLIGADETAATDGLAPLETRVEELLGEGFDRMEAIKRAARERGLRKRDAYRMLEARRKG